MRGMAWHAMPLPKGSRRVETVGGTDRRREAGAARERPLRVRRVGSQKIKKLIEREPGLLDDGAKHRTFDVLGVVGDDDQDHRVVGMNELVVASLRAIVSEPCPFQYSDDLPGRQAGQTAAHAVLRCTVTISRMAGSPSWISPGGSGRPRSVRDSR